VLAEVTISEALGPHGKRMDSMNSTMERAAVSSKKKEKLKKTMQNE